MIGSVYQETINHADELNCNQVVENLLEFLLNRWIFQEVDDVVNI